MSTSTPVQNTPGSSRRQHPGMTWMTMALLTTTTVASLRGLPTMAEYGLASMFLYVSAVFWWLSAIATQLYLLMYMLLFLTAMRLRKTRPRVERGYRAPAINFVGWIGFIASVLAFLIGFIPPSQAQAMPTPVYILSLVVGILLLGSGPFIFYALRKTDWIERGPLPT